MSLSCLRAREFFPDYGAEALSVADRRELREHLIDCPGCRDLAIRSDEGLLFSFGALGASDWSQDGSEVGAGDVARVLSGVRAGIALERAQRRFAQAPTHRRRFLVAAAAALVAFTLAFPGVAPNRRPDIASGPTRSTVSSSQRLVPAAQLAPGSLEPIPSSKFPADATIYDWNPGGGQPRVVWIVDRSLDI